MKLETGKKQIICLSRKLKRNPIFFYSCFHGTSCFVSGKKLCGKFTVKWSRTSWQRRLLLLYIHSKSKCPGKNANTSRTNRIAWFLYSVFFSIIFKQEKQKEKKNRIFPFFLLSKCFSNILSWRKTRISRDKSATLYFPNTIIYDFSYVSHFFFLFIFMMILIYKLDVCVCVNFWCCWCIYAK